MDPSEADRSSGASETVWTSGRVTAPARPLAGSSSAEVCVIGAGITGLTTALLLAQDGRDVVVLEDGAIGSGETGRTTAHLTSALDDRYEVLEKLHGGEGARLAAESHRGAIDRIEALIAQYSMHCGFERVDGYLFLSEDDQAEALTRELDAVHRAGLDDVMWVPNVPLASFRSGPALRFPNQAQLHPLRYLDGLAIAFGWEGGRLHTGTHVTKVERVEDGLLVHTSAGARVAAKFVVEATNSPVLHRVAVHTKQAPYRTYVVALPVDHGTVTPVLLWDTGVGNARPAPYHYVRLVHGEDLHPATSQDLLLVGGEDHKTGQADDPLPRWQRLEAWARDRFPIVGDARFTWSGQVMEPVDGMGFVGRAPGLMPGLYLATGDSGNGMTNGTLAADLLRDLIAGRSNPLQALYGPSRITLRSIGTWTRENLNAMGQYADWLKGSDGLTGSDEQHASDEPNGSDEPSMASVLDGTGTIERDGTKPFAVYDDPQGTMHKFSAICPHLGCIVGWNSAEATWDCPCHGSRFNALGKVVNGPANRDLTEAKPETSSPRDRRG